MKRRHPVLPALILLVCAGLLGCDDPAQPDCTEIGCLDGLRVVVDGSPGTEYAIEASAPDGTSRSATCTVRLSGTCEVGFDGFHPEEVTIVATADDGQQLTATATPDYEILQPNGPGCPPVCEHASVILDRLDAS